jgi:hypothetical protein
MSESEMAQIVITLITKNRAMHPALTPYFKIVDARIINPNGDDIWLDSDQIRTIGVSLIDHMSNEEIKDSQARDEEKERERRAKELEQKKHRRENDLGYVYIIRAGPLHKIGKSKDVSRRIKELQRSNPYQIDLIMHIKTKQMSDMEAYLHEMCANKRDNGEWFELNEYDIAKITDAITELGYKQRGDQ